MTPIGVPNIAWDKVCDIRVNLVFFLKWDPIKNLSTNLSAAFFAFGLAPAFSSFIHSWSHLIDRLSPFQLIFIHRASQYLIVSLFMQDTLVSLIISSLSLNLGYSFEGHINVPCNFSCNMLHLSVNLNILRSWINFVCSFFAWTH